MLTIVFFSIFMLFELHIPIFIWVISFRMIKFNIYNNEIFFKNHKILNEKKKNVRNLVSPYSQHHKNALKIIFFCQKMVKFFKK